MIITILISILMSLFPVSDGVILDDDFSKTVVFSDPVPVKSINSCIENLSTEQLEEMHEAEDGPLLQYYIFINTCFGDCYADSPLCCEIIIIVEEDEY